jgi:hypothetical protein
MEGAKKAVAAFASSARGVFARVQPAILTSKKRKPQTGSQVGDENIENFSDAKRTKRESSPSTPFKEYGDVSLYQNRFLCVPVLMTQLRPGDAVVLSFPLSFQSKLGAFLTAKGLNAGECFQTRMNTFSGFRIGLVGTVVRNNPTENEPWELLKSDIDGSVLYESGGGLGISLDATSGNSSSAVVIITLDDLSNDIDLWTDRHVADFDALQRAFRKMDAKSQVESLACMAKEMDPQQQIWCGREYYK